MKNKKSFYRILDTKVIASAYSPQKFHYHIVVPCMTCIKLCFGFQHEPFWHFKVQKRLTANQTCISSFHLMETLDLMAWIQIFIWPKIFCSVDTKATNVYKKFYTKLLFKFKYCKVQKSGIFQSKNISQYLNISILNLSITHRL